jgi:hypothetical protein
MIFSNWNDYQIDLLFSFWKISSAFQLAISLLIVFFASTTLHWINFKTSCLEITIHKKILFYARLEDNTSLPPTNQMWRYTFYRAVYSIISGITICLDFLVMLTVMTFQPTFMVAVILGYGFGDYLFFIFSPTKAKGTPCHI